MIADEKGTVFVSSLGWVEHSDLWVLEAQAEKAHRFPTEGGAQHLTLHAGANGLFSVGHHHGGRRFEVTVRSFADPATVLACAVVTASGSEVSGDATAWEHVPRLYVPYAALAGWRDFALVRVNPTTRSVDVQRLAWYDDRFDKGYQGVVSVTEFPDDTALFCIQRSSTLVLHDLRTGLQTGAVELGGRLGNPQVRVRARAPEMWASDLDTLVKVERQTWRVLEHRRLQGAPAGTMQFIGDFAFDPDETICAVARPFSGDVVGVDPSTMKVGWTAAFRRQPLEVAVLPDLQVVARDWKTGDLLRGELKRKRR